MIKGVTGKILWVDLTHGTCSEEAVPEKVYENYLAGVGLAAYYLYQRIPAGADALGPDNILAFVPGLLTGTGSLMTGRWLAAAKSPLTGTWGDANCGGTLSPAIKQCGYDGIFFSGISPKPVYLYVDHAHAELRDASELWGMDSRETENRIKSQSPRKGIHVACIGGAGEKCSLIAGIVNDQGRMAARSGLGAVMGSKKLKAVALSGSHPIPVADPAEMKRLSGRFLKFARFQPPFLNGYGMRLLGVLMRIMPLAMRQDGMLYKVLLKKWGTVSMNEFSIETGDAPLRNSGGSDVDFNPRMHAPINPDRFSLREEMKYHCYSCPVGCGGICKLDSKGGETHKPEYETVLALGGLLMNTDLDSLFIMNEKLNRAGMDSISAGGTLAFAIECFENGILTLEDTGGLELRWGNTDAILALLDLMIARQGLGAVLADGSKLAAERIGRDSERFAVHSGGQEPAMHDARNDPGFGLHYAVEPTPGRHTIGSILYYEMFQLWSRVKGVPRPSWRFYPKSQKYRPSRENAAMAAANSQFKMIMDGAGLCLFGAFIGVQRIPIFEWLNAATGWKKTPEEYMEIGRRVQTLRQAFNARQGADLLHKMNDRILGRPPLLDGANGGRSVPLEKLVPQYWRAMGWDEKTGQPPVEDLQAF
ncbi:aldehyde:ferredoxin oxidoreductase [Longilinea arvoryzae]|uniref:Aldehyde:ferredoxin oxidoreductase n=1 Tax=Longilinea arvoryzae TaxID=360412 RepID=A0A0S7BFB7_9CHLR|nr:aldehyde ferredoxin oxidoreductase family protein [Longilinea arvoryzae]GAP13696.1 aldehyde:ferredoxin oxidoreductase [Longilinea arvoryzae]